MSNQWQDKTRGGDAVEVTGRISNGVYVLEGRVTQSDGGAMTMTWTKDGHHVYGTESAYDLIPLEAPVDPPPDPAKVQARNRMVLALAATQYKRACDATEAAEEAEQRAHDALAVAFEQYGAPTVGVNIDGAVYLFDQGEVGFAQIEVL